MDFEKRFIPISNWAEEDQPREKLIKTGRGNLSTAELIAILIGSGTRNESAVQLSKRILISVDQSIDELAGLSVKELTKFKGIGEAKAVSIVAALELGGRRTISVAKKKQIRTSKDIFDLLHHHLGVLKHEEFWVVYLNRANRINDYKCISSGGMTGTVADPKIIFQTALEKNTCAIIIAHNHPSGNLKPSRADIDLTKKINEAGRMLDLPLLDHLIITAGGFFSFADEGLI